MTAETKRTEGMRALTIHQPWAWAIVYGGKNIENRTMRWRYRGPLAIHAGLAYDEDAVVWASGQPFSVDDEGDHREPRGAIIGVVDLAGAHDGYMGCCKPWGFAGFAPSGYGWVHLDLANVRPLPKPVPCKGRQGLWTLPEDVERAVRSALAETA